MRNGTCFLRKRWVPNISANASSCWPSAAAHDGRREVDPHSTQGANLQRTAENWPSPRAEDAESCGNHPNATDSLTGATALWATPNTPNGGRSMTPEDVMARGATENGKRQVGLENEAKLWATPTSRDHKDGSSVENVPENGLLGRMAVNWTTPTNASALHPGQLTLAGGQDLLTVEANTFPSLHPDVMITGLGSLLRAWTRPSCPVLNERFAAWLMGWPPGWSNSESAVTEWCHYRRRLHSLLCGIVCSTREAVEA